MMGTWTRRGLTSVVEQRELALPGAFGTVGIGPAEVGCEVVG
jgi:hypothetical protein